MEAINQIFDAKWKGKYTISWYDHRDGNYEIYFARLSSAGAKLGADLRVTNNASASYLPSLSWTGSEFGVSWTDYRDGNWEIYFARISFAGAKLGSDLRVTNNAGLSYWPSLSWTSSEFGVSWHDSRGGNQGIYFARIGCGNCNLTGLDIIPVASLPGGNIVLAEGAQQTFTAACTYTGSTCGVLSDDCGAQAGGVNWLYSGQGSLSTPGPSPSTIATAGQIPGPNGGSGQVSGSATYGTGSFSDSTDITITNNDTLSTVDVTPNSTVTLTEGGSQGFKAKATFSDGFTEQVACGGLLGATTWAVTGNLTAGSCASNHETITANQIPCGAGGSGTVNASYSGVNDPAPSGITVTNNDSISSVLLTPVGPLDQAPGSTVNFDCVGTWNDGCTNSEANPKAAAPVYSLSQNQSDALISSSSGLYRTGATGSSTDEARCTILGLFDGATVNVSSVPFCPGDTDCDGMPDAWEALYPACMHPTEYDDPLADFDGDGLTNLDEYYNSWDANVSNPCDESKPKIGRPGTGFFGDADGSLSIGGPDLDQVALVLSGNAPSYSRVYPAVQMVQDFDGSGSIGGPDLDYLQLMLSGNVVSPLGWPTTLSQELPAGVPAIQVGQTVAIKVRLTTLGGLERPGFGVVFSVSQGLATLFGGEGPGGGPGSRYDLTDANGEARIVLQVDAAETILVHVEMPAADPVHDLINGAAVALPSAVEITGVP